MNLSVPGYRLSPLQQGMLFHSLQEPASGVDIEQITIELNEVIDWPTMQKAWQLVIDHHDILRVRIAWEGLPEPMQTVDETFRVSFARTNLQHLSPAEQKVHITAFKASDRRRDFNFEQAPPMRWQLFEHSADQTTLIWTFHHLLLDGRSFPIVLDQIFDSYDTLMAGDTPARPPVQPFADYITWRAAQDFSQHAPFWQDQLSGFRYANTLEFGKVTATENHSGAQELRLDAELTAALHRFAGENSLSLYTLITGAWGLLLHHYTGEHDVVFGNTRACRHWSADAKSRVGLFINTLPLRMQTSAEQSLRDYLTSLRDQQVTLRDVEHTPLNAVQQWSDIGKGSNLFDTLVVLENYLLDSHMARRYGDRRKFSYQGQTNFPLALIGYNDDQFLLRIEYDTRKFAADGVGRMLGHLTTLLAAMPDHIDRPALAAPYLTADEETFLRRQARSTEHSAIGSQDSIISRFAEQVLTHTDNIALKYAAQQLTYAELNRRATQVAAALQSKGIGRENRVGLVVERSLEMVVGVLGILQAGAGYVPIDPAYPAERRNFIIEDAGLNIVVAHNATLNLLANGSADILNLNHVESGHAFTPVAIEPEQLAYIIYTSGSTGRPKGVQVTHANVVRLMDETDHWYQFNASDVWTLFHSIAFDFSVWEMWGPLLYGGTLIVVPWLVSRSPDLFHDLVVNEGVTVLNQTPSAFRQFIETDANSAAKLSLRTVIFGGEALELTSLTQWVEKHGDAQPQLVNMYGITETTVHVTYRPITKTDIAAAHGSVIGVPIPDLDIFILDAQMQAVPVGVAGEIYVGGGGVARGYLNRDALNAERFAKPAAASFPGDGQRLYKTGDVARWLPDGDIEYIGRSDFQVKIRGFRIELGEIESALRKHPSIRDCAVLAHTDANGRKQLVAYTIANPPAALVQELRDHLKQHVPDYMVPAVFMALDSFPLTNNGKLDRRALPKPVAAERAASDIVAARNQTEEQIAAIWRDTLQLDAVSVEDSFFDLGGDSLLVVRTIGRMREIFGRKLAVHHLFEHRTIRNLATFLNPETDTETQAQATASNQSNRQERVQQRNKALNRRAAMAARRKRRRT